MDREISKEVRQKEQRKQFIKLGAGIGIAVVLIGGVIGFMQTSLQRKDLVFSTVDKGVIEVSVRSVRQGGSCFRGNHQLTDQLPYRRDL